jgi:hypothetical protein
MQKRDRVPKAYGFRSGWLQTPATPATWDFEKHTNKFETFELFINLLEEAKKPS